MKLRELLIESAGQMRRGMLVQSLEQFIKDPNANEDVKVQSLDEGGEFLYEDDGEWKPIQFSPKVKAQYSAPVTPSTTDVKTDPRLEYSAVITPDELAQIVHHKNSYAIYYLDQNKVAQRVTREPIYIDQPTIEKTTKKLQNSWKNLKKIEL